MLKESLLELLNVVEYCVNFRKDPEIWGSNGCYGYPSAILLFSIADSIGSYVIGGKTRKHFDILDHPDYYNLNLGKSCIDIIYKKYRNLLTHNARLAVNVVLDIGDENSDVFQIINELPHINLLPFLKITKIVVKKFLDRQEK